MADLASVYFMQLAEYASTHRGRRVLGLLFVGHQSLRYSSCFLKSRKDPELLTLITFFIGFVAHLYFVWKGGRGGRSSSSSSSYFLAHLLEIWRKYWGSFWVTVFIFVNSNYFFNICIDNPGIRITSVYLAAEPLVTASLFSTFRLASSSTVVLFLSVFVTSVRGCSLWTVFVSTTLTFLTSALWTTFSHSISDYIPSDGDRGDRREKGKETQSFLSSTTYTYSSILLWLNAVSFFVFLPFWVLRVLLDPDARLLLLDMSQYDWSQVFISGALQVWTSYLAFEVLSFCSSAPVMSVTMSLQRLWIIFWEVVFSVGHLNFFNVFSLTAFSILLFCKEHTKNFSFSFSTPQFTFSGQSASSIPKSVLLNLGRLAIFLLILTSILSGLYPSRNACTAQKVLLQGVQAYGRVQCIRDIQRDFGMAVNTFVRAPVVLLHIPPPPNRTRFALGEEGLMQEGLQQYLATIGITDLTTACFFTHNCVLEEIAEMVGQGTLIMGRSDVREDEDLVHYVNFRERVVQAFANASILVLPPGIEYSRPRESYNKSLSFDNLIPLEQRFLFARHPRLRLLASDLETLSVFNLQFQSSSQVLSPDPTWLIGPLVPACNASVDVLFLFGERSPRNEYPEDWIEAQEHLRLARASYKVVDWHNWTGNLDARALEILREIEISALTGESSDFQSLFSSSRVHLANKLLCQGRVVVSDRVMPMVMAILVGRPFVGFPRAKWASELPDPTLSPTPNMTLYTDPDEELARYKSAWIRTKRTLQIPEPNCLPKNSRIYLVANQTEATDKSLGLLLQGQVDDIGGQGSPIAAKILEVLPHLRHYLD